jgi:uncharacterized protein (UPF0218 family)
MKTPSKLLIGVTTAAAIVAPFAPKTVNITIGDVVPVVAESNSCTLLSTVVDDRGKRFCEYRCGSQLKIKAQEGGYCEKTLNSGYLK